LVVSELYGSENEFKELFENISSGVAIYEATDQGESFIIREMNNAGLRICEATRKEIVGKDLTDLFPNVEEFGFVGALRRVWKTGKSEHSPTAFYRDNRVNGWTEMYMYKLSSGNVVAIFDRQSEIIEAQERSEALSVLNKIITLGNESTSLQEFLEKSYDQVLDIVDFDRGGIYLYNIETHHNILVLHKNIHPDFIAAVKDVDISEGLFSQVFDKNKPFYIEDFSQFMEGSNELGVYSAAIVPLRSKDKYVGSMNVGSPVRQELPQNELELLVAIGKQMGIIIQKFESEKLLKESEEKYRKSYYQTNLYRDIFAHDINNILQNIHSSAELSSLYLNNPEKLQTISELYEIIHEQVERGRKLIRNVRKINEIDDSEIELERIEVFRLLRNATEFLKNSFQARTLDIKINTQKKKTYVYANNLLLDVFENILINAVRHNNSTKIKIIIDIKKDQIEGKRYLKMEFNDNGLGISDYRKKSIFEKGTRKSQRSRGMGLGLSLVKKIIDNYQGDIWVEDRVKGDHKQGSKFVILLQDIA
jgi:signal transduction histidine kinase/PAS domain-containing protein